MSDSEIAHRSYDRQTAITSIIYRHPTPERSPYSLRPVARHYLCFWGLALVSPIFLVLLAHYGTMSPTGEKLYFIYVVLGSPSLFIATHSAAKRAKEGSRLHDLAIVAIPTVYVAAFSFISHAFARPLF